MPLDPSISLQAGAGIPDAPQPLDTLGKYMGLINSASQNRLYGIAADSQQQKLAATRMQALGNVAASALSVYDPQNPASAKGFVDALHDGIENAVQTGVIDQNTGQTLIHQIATTPHIDDLVTRAKQFALRAIDTNTAITRTYGTPGSQVSGAVTQPGIVSDPMNPRPFQPVGPPVVQQLSPSEQNEMISVPEMRRDPTTGGMKPTGAMIPMSKAEWARQNGNSQLLPGGGSGGASFPPGYAGRPPAPAGGPPAPVAAPSPLRTQTPAEGINQNAGATAGQKLLDSSFNLGPQRAMLGEMDNLLDSVSTGKKQDQLLAIRQYVQSLAPDRLKSMFGIDAAGVKNIADSELLKKLFTQFGTQAAGAAGMNTDQARNIMFGGNPNFDLSNMGNKQIIGMFKGSLDYMEAMANAWRASPSYGTGDFSGFVNQWNKTTDPRVFQFHYLDRDGRNKMLKSDPALAEKMRAQQ